MTPLFRPTVERKIVAGAKHALALLFALALFAVGGVIIWYNRTALTLTLLGAAGACFVVAMALAIPTDFKKVVVFIVPYLPDSLVGGRRKTDPPELPK